MKKLALCIPTYNRTAIVAEFLEQYADFYYHSGIDLYYYDSSENADTESVVEEYAGKYNNIYYVRVPVTCHANKKVRSIFEKFGLDQKYDYLWVCGDAVRCSKQVVTRVLHTLDKEYDLIIVNGMDNEEIGTREYADANELFHDCAWYMTLFGAVILNVRSMLHELPWQQLIDKYEITQRINYSHVGFYFEILHKMPRFRAMHFSVGPGGLWNTALKQRSGWLSDVFLILCEYWPSAVNALPEYYTDKEKVIKKLGSMATLQPWNFIVYRRENVYNLKVFLRYRKVLEKMTELNQFQLWGLACLNPGFAFCLANHNVKGYFKERLKMYSLHRYCKKFDHLYIYGAGSIAARYAKYLHRKGILLCGFLVTQKKDNPVSFQNHPVLALDELGVVSDDVGIIIGMNEKNMEEIRPVLEKLGIWDQTYHECLLSVMLEGQ